MRRPWTWIERRQARRAQFGNWLLERLTTGVGAGIFVAIGALFLASRAFPLDWSGRGDAEELVFLGTLGGCVIVALLMGQPRRSWGMLLGVAGLLLGASPVLAARWSPAGLFGGGPRLDEVVAVDVGLLILALVSIGSSWGLLRRSAPGAPAPSLSEPIPLGPN